MCRVAHALSGQGCAAGTSLKVLKETWWKLFGTPYDPVSRQPLPGPYAVARQYRWCDVCWKPRPWWGANWSVVIYDKHNRAALCPRHARGRIANPDGTTCRIAPSWQNYAMSILMIVTGLALAFFPWARVLGR
jgi:hypothetical protein